MLRFAYSSSTGHILPSLTATCQVCTVALKAGLSTYNRFAHHTLETPDSDSAKTDAHITGVAHPASSPVIARFVFQLKANSEEKGHDTFAKRFAVAR